MTTTTPANRKTEDLLRSKSVLLLHREKELLEFRQSRDRVAAWFNVFHKLSGMLTESDPNTIVSESVGMLVDHLGFEIATIYRLGSGEESIIPVCTCPNGRLMEPIAVSGAHGDPLLGWDGVIHDAADPRVHARINAATGLEKYFWLPFPVGTAHFILLAGFTANCAAFYSLSEYEAGYFSMFSNHVAALLRNARLAEQVRREQHELQTAHELLKTEMDQRERIESELRMSQKLEAVGELASGIAHEINTPIQYIADNTDYVATGFKTYSALIEKFRGLAASLEPSAEIEQFREALAVAIIEADVEFLDEEVPDALTQTMEGVEKVAAIVSAMREFARPGSQAKAPVDVNRSIEACLTVSRNEWKYVADTETDLAEDLPEVPGLVGEINQVLLNLVVNAAHAIGEAVADSDDKGTIRISTAVVDDCVEIRVSDTGTGIADDVMDHIFTPFFTTKEVGKGLGHGLAIARTSIVDKHQGTLTAESVVGEGATFTIRLPLE